MPPGESAALDVEETAGFFFVLLLGVAAGRVTFAGAGVGLEGGAVTSAIAPKMGKTRASVSDVRMIVKPISAKCNVARGAMRARHTSVQKLLNGLWRNDTRQSHRRP